MHRPAQQFITNRGRLPLNYESIQRFSHCSVRPELPRRIIILQSHCSKHDLCLCYLVVGSIRCKISLSCGFEETRLFERQLMLEFVLYAFLVAFYYVRIKKICVHVHQLFHRLNRCHKAMALAAEEKKVREELERRSARVVLKTEELDCCAEAADEVSGPKKRYMVKKQPSSFPPGLTLSLRCRRRRARR